MSRKVVYEHATCRECTWEARGENSNWRAWGHAEEMGHRVTRKVTYSSEIPAGGRS